MGRAPIRQKFKANYDDSDFEGGAWRERAPIRQKFKAKYFAQCHPTPPGAKTNSVPATGVYHSGQINGAAVFQPRKCLGVFAHRKKTKCFNWAGRLTAGAT
jgi:hypothetical protein